MRYNELLQESAARELADKLPTLKKHDYNAIDELMQKISIKHKISGKKLHDLFVHKYGHTPDTWIKKYKENLEEKVNDITEEKCPHCNGPIFEMSLMNEKKDACYYKVKSRYKVWPSAYASGALVKCRKKGASNWGNKSESIELDENLHQWFKEKWVRFGPDGKIRGDCARGDDSEGKPKCLPQKKAQSLGKKGRASAAARKRRQDPNPERSGKAINVNTKKKTTESLSWSMLDEGLSIDDKMYIFEQYGLTGNLYESIDMDKKKANEEQQLNLTNTQNSIQKTVSTALQKGLGLMYQKYPNIDHNYETRFIKEILPDGTIVLAGDKSTGKIKSILTLGGAPQVKVVNQHEQEIASQPSQIKETDIVEKWTEKYKRSIDCSHPKGFSQKAHCAGRKKHNESTLPITENILDKKGKIEKHHSAGLNNTTTMPNQNMYHGSGYLHSQFLKAVAGAGAGKTQDVNMGDKNWAGGDPVASPYHPIEQEMIDRAMKHIGDNNKVKWGNQRSQEPHDTNKVSPVFKRSVLETYQTLYQNILDSKNINVITNENSKLGSQYIESQRQKDLTDIENIPELKAKYIELFKEYKSLGGNSYLNVGRETSLTKHQREARNMEPILNELAKRIDHLEKLKIENKTK